MSNPNKISWKVFLPIVGIEFDEVSLRFSDFSIAKISSELLKKKHGITVRENFWSASVISVSVSGDTVPQDKLCNECPRRTSPHTYTATDPWGKPMEVTTRQRRNCICVDAAQQASIARTDVIDVSLKLLEDVLSILRLFISIGSGGSLPAHCLISLQRLPHYSDIAASSSTGEGYSENLVLGTRKYDVPVHQRNIDGWSSDYEFARIISAVKAAHLGNAIDEIDNIVISSLIQFGAMLEEANLRDCFLRGAAAVEAITSRVAKQGEITKKFTRLGASLAAVASHPELISDRSQAAMKPLKLEWEADRKKLKDIYEHRCDISHGSAIFSDSNDEKLFQAQQLLTKVAKGALIVLRYAAGSRAQFYDCIDEIARNAK